jgi:MFS family permease
MMLLVTAAFFACAFPLSVSWFFGWRLLSGIAGGAIMVLVAATVLPHVPASAKDWPAVRFFSASAWDRPPAPSSRPC